jgi:hypothetical protein
MFTTYGQVLITLLYGVVTTAESSGATTLKLVEKTNSIDLCALTTVTGDTVGEIYFLTGDKALILNGTGNTPVKTVGAFLSAYPYAPVILGAPATADTIQLNMTATSATHVVKWFVYYIPLEDGAYIQAA